MDWDDAERIGRQLPEVTVESSGGVLFDQEHCVGWPTLLAHLDRVDEDTLTDVLEESWRVKATASMVRAFDAGG